jgi:hypothetical protein
MLLDSRSVRLAAAVLAGTLAWCGSAQNVQVQVMADRDAHAGQPLVMNLRARVPGQTQVGFRYELLPPSPPNAVLDLGSGRLEWTPASADVGQAYQFVVRATAVPFGGVGMTGFRVRVAEPLQWRSARVLADGSAVAASWNGLADHTYRLQVRGDLTQGAWRDLEGDFVASGTGAEYAEPTAALAAMRFFRLYETRPPLMSDLTRTPLEFIGTVEQRFASNGDANLIAPRFTLPLIHVTEQLGTLWGQGHDAAGPTFQLRGTVERLAGVDGRRRAQFTLIGPLGLGAVLGPNTRTECEGWLGPSGLEGTFQGQDTRQVGNEPVFLSWSGAFSAPYLMALRYVPVAHYYFSILPKDSLEADYAEKLDRWIEEGDGKVRLNKDKKEEVLSKITIKVDPDKCADAKAVAVTEDPVFGGVVIYLSARPCQLSGFTLLDEYIHAAEFLADGSTDEEDDHNFRDYIDNLRSWGMFRKEGIFQRQEFHTHEAADYLSKVGGLLEELERVTGLSLGE